MKIYFVNPPLKDLHFSRTQRSPGVIKSGTMYYPYWLAHAAALAEKDGNEIFFLDCPADRVGRARLLSSVAAFSPDLIVLETSTPSINYDMKTATALKQCTDAKIVLVGTHVTSEWKGCFKNCKELDFVAIGEYDFTIRDLARCIESGNSVERVAGIAYRNNRSVQKTDVRLPIEDLDSLPWIAPIYKRFLTPSNYLFTIARQPMIMLIGGRGCKAKCFYCVYPQVMHGHRYRTRSLVHLVGEMKWVQKNMPEIQEIVFEDDTFTADPKRAREFARLVKLEKIRLPWFANIRTNIDKETLSALKEAGLRECAVGFESGDDLVLVNMRKGQTVRAQRNFMKMCRELGILVHGCFMVGFPGETKDSLQATLDLALELDPDSAQFYPMMPYPGTGAYQWAKDNNYMIAMSFDHWLNDQGGHRCVLDLPTLSHVEIEAYCEYAFRKFHFRPKYILRKLLQALADPKEGLRSINAGLNFIYSIIQREEISKSKFDRKADQHWRSRIKVPKGRMELIEKTIKSHNLTGELNGELQILLRKSEKQSER